MDKTRFGCWLVAAVAVVQTISTLLSPLAAELVATAVLFNAAAGFSTFLLLRRPDRNRWPLVLWTAGFFGWHVTGLVTMAGLVSTDLDAAFLIASQRELSVAYQVVLATLAGFAVHILLPRPSPARRR
ncbi:hypothetical protein ACFFQW_30855 [Umezawaea endophytica]|uniref:Uncharacterized protein n=1 Tax=Umezawaea endophytica TaxID=1654476 RepID=A0A9X2VU41_9PSEU|nr:hypothetical protein [Umezawaea endophytica]MCS7482659.1 hypothetical protein [Umezawaea endophytica]